MKIFRIKLKDNNSYGYLTAFLFDLFIFRHFLNYFKGFSRFKHIVNTCDRTWPYCCNFPQIDLDQTTQARHMKPTTWK